jgi:hypothetical protein
MNEVCFSNWDGQPVHCPFCGEALPASESASCKHLLYIITSGIFAHRSKRFDDALGFDSDNYPDLTKEEHEKHGDIYQIADKVRHSFQVQMEFIYDSARNSVQIGFAAYDDELFYWGHEARSPND